MPEPPTTTTSQPKSTDDMTLKEIFKSMKQEPNRKGIWCLGHDGVLRHFDAVRNVVDARGLTQPQIREYYNHVPDNQMPPELLTADGRTVSEWDKWHPAQRDIPRILTEEEKAKRREAREEARRLNPDFGSSGCRTCQADEGEK
ncbi:hypothetical protein B0T20DRAFT_423160 [Sordaria brevicollis]|uniref:Uncharacterized protein n=1 Tax=Sordaria brevicollis TaxID=83679 RepID=A0AAE0P2C4_SORBR|nr:hypothetical protein B0T20DRAFT_423160 [Sordaria brevicollis]